jgi:arylsulfatase
MTEDARFGQLCSVISGALSWRRLESPAVARRDAYEGFEGRARRSLEESAPSWLPVRRPPEGAPNVVVILCDDLGFADVGCYGAEVETPHVDRLAEQGVRYVDYHVTPLCSPTRAALLTGVNPHRAGVGFLAIEDHGFPGYRGRLLETVTTAAEVFRHNGYATLAAGKWHLTPRSETSEAADRSSWPLQRGFDRYYGYLGGLTNWHQPHLLHEDNHVVEVDRYPDGYYFADDVTSRAIAMIRASKAAAPAKPFFLYLAHGAMHAPLQAKPADLARHRGRYEAGWEALREARCRRQVELGLFDPSLRAAPAESAPGEGVAPWSSLTEDERAFAARQMEVYAAMVDNLDQNVGRLLAAVEELGELENTAVVFTSDNGASAGGGPLGTTAYLRTGYADSAPARLSDAERARADLIGGPRALTHYARGWAAASNAPFRLYKATAYAGGQRVPLIVSWPRGIAERGAVRRQYAYVTDVLPTLVDLLRLEVPGTRQGRPTVAMTGASFAATIDDAGAPSEHAEQYLESQGHRAFYRRGWELVTFHRTGDDFQDERWELYEVASDPAQLDELAARHPERVRELAGAWDDAARENAVYPLGDLGNGLYRLRRPDLALLAGPVRLTPAHHTLDPNLARMLLRGRSLTIAVALEHRAGDEGMLLAHGDQGGGYALYVEQGELVFACNDSFALHRVAGGPLADGARGVVLDVRAHEDGSWDVELSVDGERRGGRTGFPPWLGHTPLEGIDVGIDRRSPVCWDVYERHGPFPYSGALASVTYRPR